VSGLGLWKAMLQLPSAAPKPTAEPAPSPGTNPVSDIAATDFGHRCLAWAFCLSPAPSIRL
jgi:hypothetical protein